MTGTIKQLSVQLDQWRGMLPSYLCWQEGQGENISTLAQSAFPPHISGLASSYVFATDLNIHAAAADIQVAILRTRYYYARYLVHRPYLYKALHHPESMTHEDAEGVAIALKSIRKWPRRGAPFGSLPFPVLTWAPKYFGPSPCRPYGTRSGWCPAYSVGRRTSWGI